MSDYFIRIDDATDLRRKVLECSKASINVLRSYQQIIKVRGEKQTMISSLRRELKELTMLLNKAEAFVPALSKSEVEVVAPKKVETPNLPMKVQVKVPPQKPVLQKPKVAPKDVAAPNEVQRQVYLGTPERRKEKLVVPVAAPKQEVPQPPKKSELETLHEKLSSIEEKLRQL